jgi:hypothetical protein
MNDTISKGNRIKIGRSYGTVGLVTTNNIWYWDEDGRYRCVARERAERVHGSKGVHKNPPAWPV